MRVGLAWLGFALLGSALRGVAWLGLLGLLGLAWLGLTMSILQNPSSRRGENRFMCWATHTPIAFGANLCVDMCLVASQNPMIFKLNTETSFRLDGNSVFGGPTF